VKRDVETILTMGIMEDVTIIPQPVGGEANLFSSRFINNLTLIFTCFLTYVLVQILIKLIWS
jgi:hypothetical protein